METTVNNYIVVIDDLHTLQSVRATSESTSDLDLSDLSLEFISKDAFLNLDNLRTLNLSRNSLYSLPAFVFTSLKCLERLSLANNELRRMANAFAGLENLRTLDLRNNSMWYIAEGYFHGLSRSAEILLAGNDIDTISSLSFERRPEANPNDLSRERRKSSLDAVAYYEEKAREARMYLYESEESAEDAAEESDDIFQVEGYPEAKILIVEGCLRRVEYLKKDEPLLEGHIKREIGSPYFDSVLDLGHLKIRSFQRGWYGLEHDDRRHKPVVILNLSGNDIERVTGDLLDDLPAHVAHISLNGNKIERLEGGVFLDRAIKHLDLSKNLISEIEEGALQDLPLVELNLEGNRLRDTRFASSLPSTLQVLRLENNEVVELTAGAFSRLNKVHIFQFQGNKIETLLSDSLRGLTSMCEVSLADQRLRIIEAGAFRDLEKLQHVEVNGNQLESLDSGVFQGWPTLHFASLSLRSNKLRLQSLPEWPENLVSLDLSDNGIGDLKAGDFVRWSCRHLELAENGITRIEPGSFDMPKLRDLTLNKNALGNLDGECFEGLPNLRRLSLFDCGITRIQKGFMKHLGGLETLNLRSSDIKRLDNGALFGIQKATEATVHITEPYLQVIQGGVFDDV